MQDRLESKGQVGGAARMTAKSAKMKLESNPGLSVPTAIHVNLWADYIVQLKKIGQSKGLRIKNSEDDDAIALAVWNRIGHEIDIRPRKVHWRAGFNIPAKYGIYSSAVDAIEQEIQAGADLNRRLSKQFRKWQYVDLMLADFGIHHLHMSLPNGLKFKGIDNPLLYAMFEPNDAYVLMVSGHNEWANHELLEIVHTNWPGSIKHYKLPVLAVERSTSASDRTLLRKNGIDALIRLKDGSVYLPPGGGLSTDGSSTRIAMHVLSHRRALRNAEKIAYEWVKERLATQRDVGAVIIKLAFDESGIRAIEPVTGLNWVIW
jgi:hypothetical protein